MRAFVYFNALKITCQFQSVDTGWSPCSKPAAAVYVADDDSKRALYICQAHAVWAEDMGDGPVFWANQGTTAPQSVEKEPDMAKGYAVIGSSGKVRSIFLPQGEQTDEQALKGAEQALEHPWRKPGSRIVRLEIDMDHPVKVKDASTTPVYGMNVAHDPMEDEDPDEE